MNEGAIQANHADGPGGECKCWIMWGRVWFLRVVSSEAKGCYLPLWRVADSTLYLRGGILYIIGNIDVK